VSLRTSILAIAGALTLVACASTPSSTRSSSACPNTVGGFVAGEATSEFVRGCLGKPKHEDRNPDGRYVYLYDIDKGTTVAFLFDSAGRLVRTRGYQQN